MAAEAYYCIRKCYFRHRLYNLGDREVFDKEAGDVVPRHFEPVPPPRLIPEPDDPKKKTILKGLRAPVDPDQAEKVKAKKMNPEKRGPGRPRLEDKPQP